MFFSLLRYLKVFGLIGGFIGCFVLSFVILTEGLGVPGTFAVMLVIGLILIQCWLVSAYVRYRIARQEELLQVLRSAVSSNVSIEGAVQAYLQDRPSHTSGPTVMAIVALILTPIFPGALFLMLWFHWNRYDKKVAALREHLYEGLPLSEALRLSPGVLSDEARLDIRVGTESNRLKLSLERADRERLAGAWIELVPRVAYPFAVFMVLISVNTFAIVMLVPKFKKIFDEFGMKMPEVSKTFIGFATWLSDYAYIFVILKLAALLAFIQFFLSPTFRWRMPLLGRYYRADVQGRVLRSLGLLFEAEAPAKDALDFLADSEELPGVVRRKLGKAADQSAAGEPLATVLVNNDLLPKSMAPLIIAAEKTQTLPWALRELGEHLSLRALRTVRRATLILSPLVLVVLGVGVGFTCVALFLPLVQLLIGLS
ncbi:type II secretion system F family protein [soil metagenome]